MLTGGCLCGAIRYEAGDAPFHATLCHCSMCRRAAGAPVVAWFSVAATDFRITQGEPQAYRSSQHGTRRFCGRCGTQLTFTNDATGGEVDITTASLDDPGAVPPEDHTRTSARISWLQVCDSLPSYGEARSDG